MKEFWAELQECVAELTKRDGAVILDAATGAGGTTLRIAEAMNGGKLITVDCDPVSWNDWARPLLDKAGLLGRVEFIEADIRKLPLEDKSVDLVVSHSTLSAMAIYAADAIREFHRVLKEGGRLFASDLIPEKESQSDPTNISALSWRLMKAAAHLAGEDHYEELPTDWIRTRLEEAGFTITSFHMDPTRQPAPTTNYDEWRSMDLAAGIADPTLAAAIRHAQQGFIERAQKEGLSCQTGRYQCWASK